MLCQVQNRYNEDQLSCFVQSNVSSRVWSTEDGSTWLLVTSWNLSSVPNCSCSSLQSNQNCCVVLSRGSSQPDDHGQMISEKWTSLLRNVSKFKVNIIYLGSRSFYNNLYSSLQASTCFTRKPAFSFPVSWFGCWDQDGEWQWRTEERVEVLEENKIQGWSGQLDLCGEEIFNFSW